MVCLRCVYVICCFIGELGNNQTFQKLPSNPNKKSLDPEIPVKPKAPLTLKRSKRKYRRRRLKKYSYEHELCYV